MKLNFSGSWGNPDKATQALVRTLNIRVTDQTIRQCVTEHPDHPSLLSISDCLNEWKVSHQPLRVDKQEVSLDDIPVPFIAHLLPQGGSFALVSRVTGKTVTCSDEKRDAVEMSRDEFMKQWDGIILQAEPDAQSGEKDFAKRKKEEQNTRLLHTFMALGIPLLALLAIINLFLDANGSVFSAAYTFLGLLGCVAGVLLVWYDIDQYNPVIQQICSAGKKVNCGAVLQSKESKIFGISWSSIGLTYFAGNLFFTLFSGAANPATQLVLSGLSILAAAYTLYSVYYQWLVIKQWCILCLYVQAVLLLQLGVVLAGGWYAATPVSVLGVSMLLNLALAFFVPAITLGVLLPALRKAKESKKHKTELQRLKHNPQIFGALLEKQNMLAADPRGLGISLGKAGAPYQIIKVCNPYCGPCAKAHPAIEELLHTNPDVQVRIIFTASGKEGDRLTPPVQHLMAIAARGDEALTKQALDDWYLADKKDYDLFAAKYPMNGELKQQADKIEAMRQWCDAAGVKATPTFFVSMQGSNFYQLPDIYRVSDLGYFLAQ